MKEVEIYYLRRRETVNGVVQNMPYAAVAVKINPDKTVSRGVAICSGADKFVKSKGRNLALARLNYAETAKGDRAEIRPYNGKAVKARCPAVPFRYLASYCDTPNDTEKKMFRVELGL